MLLFTHEGGQWKRGGRHFPRSIRIGQTRGTGSKYIQGVEVHKKQSDSFSPEGRWCSAKFSGWTSSWIRAEHAPSVMLGGKRYDDVLKLIAAAARPLPRGLKLEAGSSVGPGAARF